MENTSSRNKLSRRQAALSLLAGTAAAPLLASQIATDANASPQNTSAPRRRESPPETPPFGQAIEFERKEAPRKVNAFALSEVRITGGPCKEAQELNLAYLKRLDNNRLLHNFRVNAGLPSSAQPLGGWEKPDCELRGHFVGHFLSACALMYASTGDQEIKSKGDALVASLAECQQKLGGGYLSAFPTEYMERLKMHKKVWAPFYTYHKIMAGMLDMHHHAQNQQALAVVEGMAKWVDDWTAPIPEPQMQSILNVEYGGMNEVLYTLAFATGNDHYAAVGDRFTKKWFFNPLALRRDELRGLHANTHIPQVIGAARRYELSSDERFHDVADFFWYEITSARAYVTGGTSNSEHWLVEPRRLGAELKKGPDTTECCCAYNMLKLTRSLYEWTADPRYFDYYERVLLNHRLGTLQPGTGHTQYYLSIVPAAWKTFATENDSFWCCNGTGVEEYSKLNDSVYFHDDHGVYVNLFIPSELRWRDKNVSLIQETDFPEDSATLLRLHTQGPVEFALHLRIPEWTGDAATVKVNGKVVDAVASGGSYLTLQRTWHNGDRVEMQMPMRLHIEAMPDEPSTQAILYGPLVLAGDLGTNGLTPEMIQGQEGPDVPNARIAISAFRAAAGDPATWIQPADKPLAFRTTGQQQDVSFEPLYRTFRKRYSIYWTVNT
jgi:DUF1680 family protein